MVRMARCHADERARAEARHQAELAQIDRQLADVRARLVDLEGTGIADLGHAPVGRRQLGAFAR
jgi:hypothetical protein